MQNLFLLHLSISQYLNKNFEFRTTIYKKFAAIYVFTIELIKTERVKMNTNETALSQFLWLKII